MKSTLNDWIIASTGTSQNNEIFSFNSSVTMPSLLRIITFVLIPKLINSLYECCVGFVLSSLLPGIVGTKVVWINNTSSFSFSAWICLIASKKGNDSMSPTVPPISVITISACDSSAALYTAFFISSVICGITCTVLPL